MPVNAQDTLNRVINEAVDDISATGYDSAEKLAYWQLRIKEAAERALGSRAKMEELLRSSLASVYRRLIEKGGAIRYQPGIGRFTVERLKPTLRAELTRRMLASADLIRLNRQAAIEKTLQRFAGWSTSVPRGGAAPGAKRETKVDLKKAMKQLPFVERRVLIDQGHKLTASLNEIIAVDGGAIAGIWHSHWRQANYDYREDHKERDGQVYLLKESWALEKGYVKPGPAGYYHKITAASEEPFCRCYVTWIHQLSSLPAEMLTVKGANALTEVRRKIKEMKAR